MEEHSSNYPGCRKFSMIDLDKKVANKVCANSKGSEDILRLENSSNKASPYTVKIRTGCKNEPRKGERFCRKCMGEFSVHKEGEQNICFLQSLHPLGSKKRKRHHVDRERESFPDAGWILVKQFGVTYKF